MSMLHIKSAPAKNNQTKNNSVVQMVVDDYYVPLLFLWL